MKIQFEPKNSQAWEFSLNPTNKQIRSGDQIIKKFILNKYNHHELINFAAGDGLTFQG